MRFYTDIQKMKTQQRTENSEEKYLLLCFHGCKYSRE